MAQKYIEKDLVHFYIDLMTKEKIEQEESIRRISQHIPHLVTRDQNDTFMREISQEEVDSTMKEMDLGKYLGSDGFTTNFFHHS